MEEKRDIAGASLSPHVGQQIMSSRSLLYMVLARLTRGTSKTVPREASSLKLVPQ